MPTCEVEYLSEIILRYGDQSAAFMAFLEAYYDESGSHGAKYLAVCGFLGLSTNWIRFSRQWDSALKDQGVPYFKAQWFAKRKEFFRGAEWDDNRRKGFMGRLLSIIDDAHVIPISISMPMEVFERIVTAGQVRTAMGSAYTLCAQQAILKCCEWANENAHTERINYFFDEGHANRGDFEEAHRKDALTAGQQFLIGNLTFTDEKKVPPLQAADLLAYECSQYLAGKQNRHPLNTIRRTQGKEFMYSEEWLTHSFNSNRERGRIKA